VSRYQKGKTNLNFHGARDSEWQWHQLGHMQVCTSLQTDNHASTPPLRITSLYTRTSAIATETHICLHLYVTCAFRVVSKYLVSVYVLLLGYQYHQYYCELWSFRLDLVYWSWSNFLNTQELFRAVVSADWTCIWPSGCHCHSLSLASVKFRSVLPFWYWLTRVVPEKGLLNGCV